MKWSILTCLALLLMSGCAEENPSATEDDAGATIITEPTDYSYLENQTDGSGWHVHDYWRGQESLVLFDETDQVDFSCPGCSYVSYGFGAYRFPAGTIVPQGTSHVLVTVTYDFDGPHPQPEVFIKTAADVEAESYAFATSGAPIQINSSQDQNDPPHQSLSGWQVPIRLSGTSADNYDFTGTIRVHIEAFRGLDIPEWPPHPDHWQGQNQLVLFQDRQGSALLMEESAGRYSCYGICDWNTERPDDGALVPFDTEHVVVQLTYDAGLPAGLALTYHGADAWNRTRIEPAETAPGSATFLIPVDAASGDSPYAKQSLWEFRLVIDDQPVDPNRWSGGYTLSATAMRT